MGESATYTDLIAAGEAALISKDAAHAISLLERALAINPNGFQGIFGLLLAYDQLGETDKCLRLGERVLREKPNHTEVINKMAFLYAQIEEWKDAKVYIDRAIKLQPENMTLRQLRLGILDNHSKSIDVCSVMESDAGAIYSSQLHIDRKATPFVLVCALPKSASSSIEKGLELALGVPSIEDELIAYSDELGFPRAIPMREPLRLISQSGGIGHSHLKPTPETLEILSGTGIERVVVTIRDPRQSLVSWIHHSRGGAANQRIKLIEPTYNQWQHDDKVSWHIEHFYPQFVDWIEGWCQAGRRDPNIHVVEFSHFVANEVGTVREIASAFNLPAIEITEVPRKRFRSGQLDSWKEFFTPSQCTEMTRVLPTRLTKPFG